MTRSTSEELRPQSHIGNIDKYYYVTGTITLGVVYDSSNSQAAHGDANVHVNTALFL